MNEDNIPRDIVTIGASAGGVQALLALFAQLPSDLPCTVGLVLHRSPYHASHLSEILARRSRLAFLEPVGGELMKRGHVYIAPRDRHMIFDGARIRLNRGPKVHFTRPAADPLFLAAAKAYGPRVVGVVLSGHGSDGVDGLIAIKAAGGISLAQKPEEALHPSMPLRSIRDDHVDGVLDIEGIAIALVALTRGASVPDVPGAGR